MEVGPGMIEKVQEIGEMVETVVEMGYGILVNSSFHTGVKDLESPTINLYVSRDFERH